MGTKRATIPTNRSPPPSKNRIIANTKAKIASRLPENPLIGSFPTNSVFLPFNVLE